MGKRYVPHTEQCLRFGFSDDCPACQMVIEKENEKEKKSHKEIRRYKHASKWRKY
jgi:hypothetical protein